MWVSVLLRLRKLGRRPALAVLVFGLFGIGGSAAIGISQGVPVPEIHDEFSYLLAADTFADGRLTNPTHPYWQHFETFHVNHVPTYASKYPPAQGLVLALGQVTTGLPIAGVWLSTGLLSAATVWMLLQWLPPVWAVLATIFCTSQLCWLSYWNHSYWGGAVAAAAGAIAFGAFKGLCDNPRPALGAGLGIGLGLLAASRPYEGAVAGICIAVALIVRLLRRRDTPPLPLVRALLYTASVLALSLAWLGYYNWRVTGSALTMPYQVNEAQYAAAPSLLFQAPGPAPQYRHREIERFWKEYGAGRYVRQRELKAQLTEIPSKVWVIATAFLGLPGLLGLLGLRGAMRGWPAFALAAMTAIVTASLLTTASWPHYAAPAASLFFVTLGTGLRHLHRQARRKRAVNLAILTVIALLVYVPTIFMRTRQDSYPSAVQRAAVLERLQSEPTKNLVIVLYEPDHNYLFEWVYNRADIDRAKVVWARSMGASRDRELATYFSDRTVWTLAVVDDSATLTPYPRPDHVLPE